MSDLLVKGRTFAGRYRIERFLAQGGFGAVYVAEQLETDLRVALKVLVPRVLFDDDAIAKFRLEARIGGRVRSEHIVKVFDAGFDEESGMPFLVMELLDGQDLEARVQATGPLEPALVVRLMRQIASALDKAHGYIDRDGVLRPIIHRDLKPANLFLTRREDGELSVKVLDFGIAKVLGDSQNLSRDVKGTPIFMAYEQIAAESVGPGTDIWALGLIVFFLLTGKYYWNAANRPQSELPQLFAELLSLPLVPLSQRARELGVPGDWQVLDAWFARCVARDRAQRFATAGECAATLALALGSPESALRAAGSPAPEQTLADAAWPVAVPAATGGPRSTGTPLVVSPRATGPRGSLIALVGALAVTAVVAWFVTRPSVEAPREPASDAPVAALASTSAAPAQKELKESTPPASPSASAAPTPGTSRAIGSARPPNSSLAAREAPIATATSPKATPKEDIYGDR